eukprot:TRINITY_DN76177_c0_g1_i1.p1 TRINITY_DN76177_c0_g1~~TRINITY_DN76177_c0_g1_i1.p1  ORF type:complete len:267 (-),score=56.72 TRINITY_DN76177_c0_g1_i1:54-854(-)
MLRYVLLSVQLLASAGVVLLQRPPKLGHSRSTNVTAQLPVAKLGGQRANASLAAFSICAMGDSITDGLQGHDDVYVNRGGFRPMLEAYVESRGGELTGYRTCPCPAYPNARSSQLHMQLKKEDFLCGSLRWGARKPDIALVLVGTNDIVQGVPVPQALKSVSDMLNDLWTSSPHTTVLLASIPVHRGNPGPFDQYNAGLKNLVISMKPYAPIEYVPMSEDTGICAQLLCSPDMIHPTREGYQQMADEWWKFVEPRLPLLTISDPGR